MDKENKTLIITVVVIVVLIACCFGGIKMYSGLDSSLTVVTSGSMEHGDDSQIGPIDTGDMVVLRNKNSGITTFVDGCKSGYQKFGEYGDVIVYNRVGQNPVIHRAVLWIDYVGGHFSAPSLKNYDSNLYNVDGSWDNFTTLELKMPNWEKGSGTGEWVFYEIDLSSMNGSGYLTKGDSNPCFDQSGGIADELITVDGIRAVAGFELPWLGLIKLGIDGNTGSITQSNSWACLLFLFLDFIALVFVVPIVIESLIVEYSRKKNS